MSSLVANQLGAPVFFAPCERHEAEEFFAPFQRYEAEESEDSSLVANQLGAPW